VLQYLRPKGLSGVGVNYSLYFSDNLTDWNHLEATEQITDLGGAQEKVTVPDPVPVPTRESRYLLLAVDPVR